jgi:hypothetical protein
MLSSVIRSRAYIFLFCANLIFWASSLSRAGDLYTPAMGTPERKAIMDALRPPVEKELHSAVIFKVDRLNVLAGWAFLIGVPQRPDGGMIDYRKTIHREAYDFGAFDDRITALLHSKDGVWRVVKYNIGATDVVWEDWPQKYGAPPQIFH